MDFLSILKFFGIPFGIILLGFVFWLIIFLKERISFLEDRIEILEKKIRSMEDDGR